MVAGNSPTSDQWSLTLPALLPLALRTLPLESMLPVLLPFESLKLLLESTLPVLLPLASLKLPLESTVPMVLPLESLMVWSATEKMALLKPLEVLLALGQAWAAEKNEIKTSVLRVTRESLIKCMGLLF